MARRRASVRGEGVSVSASVMKMTIRYGLCLDKTSGLEPGSQNERTVRSLLEAGLGRGRRGPRRRGLRHRAPDLSLIHISEPTRQAEISYAVFCLKKKK